MSGLLDGIRGYSDDAKTQVEIAKDCLADIDMLISSLDDHQLVEELQELIDNARRALRELN